MICHLPSAANRRVSEGRNAMRRCASWERRANKEGGRGRMEAYRRVGEWFAGLGPAGPLCSLIIRVISRQSVWKSVQSPPGRSLSGGRWLRPGLLCYSPPRQGSVLVGDLRACRGYLIPGRGRDGRVDARGLCLRRDASQANCRSLQRRIRCCLLLGSVTMSGGRWGRRRDGDFCLLLFQPLGRGN